MSDLTYYSTGTISVGSGSTSVTGAGTAWLTSGLRAGDRIYAAGNVGIIQSVNTNTSITLKRPFPVAVSGGNYDAEYVDDGARSLAAANQLVTTLSGGTLLSLAGLAGGANKLPYFDGVGSMAQSDLTAAARAILGLTGASGAKIPVVTGAGSAALRDIVGTVSQSGGVTTGAMFEVGSNANGHYQRTADGVQECWQPTGPAVTCDIAYGSVFRSAATTWTLPATMARGATNYSVSANANVNQRMAGARPVGVNTANFWHQSAVSSSDAVSTNLKAKGYWY